MNYLLAYALFGNHSATINGGGEGGGGLVWEVIQLVIYLIVLGIVAWLVGLATIIDARIKQIINVILIVVAAVLVIDFLMSLAGHPFL